MNFYLKHGLILSAFQVSAYLLTYFVSKTSLFSSAFLWFSYLFSLAYVIYQMYQFRERNNGVLDYGNRFKICFLILIISTISTFTLQMALLHTDKALHQAFEAYQVKTSMWMNSGLKPNMNKYELEELRLDTIDQMKMMGSLSNNGLTMIVSGLFNACLMILLLSLLYATFIGNEKISIRERIKRLNI